MTISPAPRPPWLCSTRALAVLGMLSWEKDAVCAVKTTRLRRLVPAQRKRRAAAEGAMEMTRPEAKASDLS